MNPVARENTLALKGHVEVFGLSGRGFFASRFHYCLTMNYGFDQTMEFQR